MPTKIDLAASLHDKIGVDIEPHRILGVCRPQLAAEALGPPSTTSGCCCRAPSPCPIVAVAVLDPHTRLTLTDNPALGGVAADARDRLDNVLHTLQQQ